MTYASRTMQQSFTTDRLMNQEGGGVEGWARFRSTFYCLSYACNFENKCLNILLNYFIYFSGKRESFEFGAARRLE
jgi:hypothetical protein